MTPEQFEAIFDKVSKEPALTSHLRKLILHLAMSGKMTSAVAGDGNIDELVAEIEDNRQKLIKSKSIKNNKVVLGDLPDNLPEIPSRWAWSRLGMIGDWGSGSTPKRGETAYYGGDYIWLKSGELRDNKNLTDSEEKVTAKAIAECSFRVNQPGDVLIAMYGATIGSIGIVEKEAVTNQAVCGCTPFKGIDNYFLFYFLASYRDNFTASSVGGAQPNISKEKIVATCFPLPPLEEQKRIVAKVDELMALCDELEGSQKKTATIQKDFVASSILRLQTDPARTFEELIEANLNYFSDKADLLHHTKNELVSLAIQGKFLKGGSSHPAFIPLGELCSKTGSGSTPRGGKSVYQDSGIALLRSQNIYDDGLRLNDVAFIDEITHEKMKGTRVFPGDLLLNITGGSIGRCCIVPPDSPEMNVSQHVSIIRPKDQNFSHFLHLVITSPYFQNQIRNEQTGAGREGLPKKKMDLIPIPVYSSPDQQEITEQAQQLATLFNHLHTCTEKEEAIKSDLLKTLVA